MKTYSTKKITFNGTLVFVSSGVSYEAEVYATANYYYQPCVMYFKDGSGQPEDEELEIDDYEIKSLRNEDSDTDCLEKYNNDEFFKKQIDEDLTDALIDMDSDKWCGEDDLDYDAEEDYYEELARER